MAIHIIDAGGTITSAADAHGALQGAHDPDALRKILPPGLPPVTLGRAYTGLSEAMALTDFAAVAEAIAVARADPQVHGIVIAHGTDTMEESAYYADLLHDGSKPVVFTGAQRAAAAPDFDGHRNLADAVRLASLQEATAQGVMIAFGGRAIPAAQAGKVHLTDLCGFAARNGDSGTIGKAGVTLPAPRPRPAPFARGGQSENVALVALAAGVSGRIVDAVVAAGYRGLVVAALGSGNAPPAVCAALERAMAAGVIVVLGTRCGAGTVAPVYDSGHRLITAGALSAGNLPVHQARILLATVLENAGDVQDPRAVLAEHLAAA